LKAPLRPSGTATVRSKGCLSNKTALAMVFKLVEGAQKSWPAAIDGHNQLPKLIQGGGSSLTGSRSSAILPRLQAQAAA